MKHLHSNGKYIEARPTPYSVRVLFPNANADHTIVVSARSKANARWVAAEQIAGTMGTVGEIKKL